MAEHNGDRKQELLSVRGKKKQQICHKTWMKRN